MLPTKGVKEKTPFEAWHGYKPSLLNLIIFGCLCISHILQVKRDNLDKNAEYGVSIDHSIISKAYRILLPHTVKIMVSIHVFILCRMRNRTGKKLQEEYHNKFHRLR